VHHVTLKDIAARAGVSVATVSLALSGRGLASRSTVERLRALAEEMGYRPNPLLSSLAGQRFRSPAAVGGSPLAIFNFPSMREGSGDRSDYPKYLEAEAKKMGYAPKAYPLTNKSNAKTLFRELYHRMTQGIVITGSMDEKTFGAGFDWSHFSTVQCARFHALQPFHTVRPNIFQAVKLAFTQLQARGYERIGFGLGQHDELLEDDEVRQGAAISLQTNHLLHKNRIPVYTGGFNDQDTFLAWIDRWQPDAIVGFSLTQYWFLKNHGLRIPEDIGFASLHLTDESLKTFSGLFQNAPSIARQSILLLDQMVRHRERGYTIEPLNLLVPSTWNEGSTLRPLAPSPPPPPPSKAKNRPPSKPKPLATK
jgi:LacI family transcriptional regulator